MTYQEALVALDRGETIAWTDTNGDRLLWRKRDGVVEARWDGYGSWGVDDAGFHPLRWDGQSFALVERP